MSRSAVGVCMAGVMGLVGVAHAADPHLCRPTLKFENVAFSGMRPPTLERKWSANVSVDASHCAANATGRFEIVFLRLKETAPEFIWFLPVA